MENIKKGITAGNFFLRGREEEVLVS